MAKYLGKNLTNYFNNTQHTLLDVMANYAASH
jgi:hypothetical protein